MPIGDIDPGESMVFEEGMSKSGKMLCSGGMASVGKVAT